MTQRHVVLVGLPGAGKTTIAQAVGARINLEVVELDAEVERIAGVSIPRIFANLGEASFRRFEVEATRNLLGRPASALVAAGGGWIANARARELVPLDWPILYLRVAPRTAAERLGAAAGHRPLLARARSAEQVSSRLERLATERVPLYERATAIVDTDRVPLDEVIDRTVDLVRSWLEA